MTAPLHHVNQLYLHLPAMGGFVAGQAAAGEEIQRLARLEEAKVLYRDAVEVVSAVKDTVAIEPIRPEPEPGWRERRRRRRPEGPRAGAGAPLDAAFPEEPLPWDWDRLPEGAASAPVFDLSVEPVVDVRV